MDMQFQKLSKGLSSLQSQPNSARTSRTLSRSPPRTRQMEDTPAQYLGKPMAIGSMHMHAPSTPGFSKTLDQSAPNQPSFASTTTATGLPLRSASLEPQVPAALASADSDGWRLGEREDPSAQHQPLQRKLNMRSDIVHLGLHTSLAARRDLAPSVPYSGSSGAQSGSSSPLPRSQRSLLGISSSHSSSSRGLIPMTPKPAPAPPSDYDSDSELEAHRPAGQLRLSA
jgi:hypothetical protein